MRAQRTASGLMSTAPNVKMVTSTLQTTLRPQKSTPTVPFDFTVVVVSAIVICFAATIYPSGHAARLDPAQALRYS